MTRKIYKTAQGKNIDLGALLLQNENVRAVGNMNVNARGDLLDSGNKVIDQKNRQVQRQYKRQTNVTQGHVVTSTREAKKLKAQMAQQAQETQPPTQQAVEKSIENEELFEYDVLKSNDETESTEFHDLPKGGLAAAIARSRAVKQELEKPLRPEKKDLKLRKL